MEKWEQTQTNFLRVLRCLSAGSNVLFGAPLKSEARKLSSPYIFVAGVQLTSLSFHFSLSTPQKTRVGGRDTRFPLLPGKHTRILDLQFSLVILKYNKSLNLIVQRLFAFSFIYQFIYLCIQF